LENPGIPDFERRCCQRGTKPHGRRGLSDATQHFGAEVSSGGCVAKAYYTETRGEEPRSEILVSEVRPKVNRHAGER
jgi:hypothetical protein